MGTIVMNASKTALLIILLFLFSFALNIYNNGFDYLLHCDEAKKVTFIKNGTQDFKHPILMLQISRAMHSITGYGEDQDIAVEGRYASAFMGACIIIGVFFLSRRLMETRFAVLAALSAAVSPMIVVHAHYLKEDVYSIAPLLFSLLFLLRMIETQRRSDGLLFGFFYGLALSAQYKSLLFLVILAILPLLDRNIQLPKYFRQLSRYFPVAALTFLAVNYNILLDMKEGYYGMQYELLHAANGHAVKVYPLENLFLFHFKHSLIPGMTLPVITIACLGLLIALFRWKKSSLLERIILVCVALFYFAHELSPLKPAPAFIRYMVPIAPMLTILAWLGVEKLYRATSCNMGKAVGYGVISIALFAMLLFPAYDTANIVANLIEDTRIMISDQLADLDGEYVCEQFVLPGYNREDCVYSAADVDIEAEKKSGVCYVVTSSMDYDRFYYGAEMPDQNESVYRRHQGYVDLFEHPYVELRPQYRTFAFSNPVIRIVDICAN